MKSVFAFEDPVDFLQFYLEEQQRLNARFSLRQWAREIGYENPSYLSHVLKQERRLKPDMVRRLADNLKLTGRSRKYFEAAVLRKNSDSDTERATYDRLMREMKPRKGLKENKFSLEMVSVLSDWYHLAVLEIAALAQFDGTLKFLEVKLAGLASRRQVSQAVGRLIRVGMLKRDSSGRLARVSIGSLVYQGGVPSASVRRTHRQFMELAVRALEEQSVDERFNRCATVAIPEDRVIEARSVMVEAIDKILALVNGSKSKHVYQCNVQLFRLSARDKGDLQ
jgi:uncharacterized protein (TIGR02147 family)